MRVTLSRKDLRRALIDVSPLAVRQGYRGRDVALVASERAFIYASDASSYVERQVEGMVDEPGQVIFNATKLPEWLALVDGETVTVESVADETTADFAKIETDAGQRVVYPGNRVMHKSFPEIAINEFARQHEQDLVVWESTTLDAIRQVLPFSSRDDSRPILTGVLIEPDGIVATDSYRLARVDMDTGIEKPLLLPRSVLRVAIGKHKSAEMTVRLDPLHSHHDMVEIRTDGIRWRMRPILGQFPTWRSLVPPNSSTLVSVNRESLLRTVSRAALFAFDTTTPVRLGRDAKGQFTGEVVNSFPDRPSLFEPLEVDTNIEFLFALNPRYFRDILKAMTCEVVNIYATDELKPVKFVDGTFTALLMPVRVP